MFTGALLAGRYADKFGRRITLIYSALFQFAINATFYFIDTKISILLGRYLQGYFFGFSIPISLTYVSEIVPVKYRGKLTSSASFAIALGKLSCLGIASLVLEGFDKGNWKLYMFLSSISTIFTCLGFLFYIKELPRFLLSIEKFDEAREIIDYVGSQNNGDKWLKLS